MLGGGVEVRPVLRVAWYRFTVTLRVRLGGYLALVLLIGLVAGVGMAAVAAARRTQSSFPAYLASTNPAQLQGQTAAFDPSIGSDSGYDASLIDKISRLPHVKRTATFTIFNPNIVALDVPNAHNGDGIAIAHGHQLAGEQPATIGGSADGEFSTMDRPFVTSGRIADPTRDDEAVVTPAAARRAGLHVGSVVPIGVYTNAQTQMDDCCSAAGSVRPYRRIRLKIVGIVVLNNGVVQDDVDALGNDFVLVTPAFDRTFRQCCAQFSGTKLQLERGSRDIPTVIGEIGRLRNKTGGPLRFGDPNPVLLAKAERAIKPEAIALGVFGAIAALASFVIAAQLISRQLLLGSDELSIVRALGADPGMTLSDGLIGVLVAVVGGALLAAAIAIGLSPLAPLGPARAVDNHPGVAVDWTVVGLGLVVIVGALSAISTLSAYRQMPHRVARRRERTVPRGSRLARAATSALPTPAATGIRFALDASPDGSAVPVRSAIVAAVLALVVVSATVVFGTSLNTLVSHPPLYGWNWDYELLSGYGGHQDLPQHQTERLLRHDRYVAASAGVYFAALLLDGQGVPVLGASPKAAVAPPLLSGHGLDAPDQVVLGATTLADLHKHLGDTVVVSSGRTRPTRLRIVGTATMPAIGNSGNLHPTMGTGALLSYKLIPAQVRNAQQSSIPGPNAVLIRFHDGVDRAAALRSLQKINATLNAGPDGAGGVASVQRPAEIVNYRAQQTTPAYLGATLAVGATSALALTLIASVRRRRRDLALLKTLGFTRRQLSALVAWQSTAAVAIGIAVGVPLGIVLGRGLWDLFAHAIHAVPQPTVPTLTIVLIALGALVLANLVAALPARQAARTPTVVLLRAE